MTEVAQLFFKLRSIFPQNGSEGQSKPQLTNTYFRLHSDLTFVFLTLSSILLFTQQLLGVHMKCLVPSGDDLRPSAVVTYCFITGTYTLPELIGSRELLSSHIGVGTHIEGKNEQKFHYYFQWVPFVLLFEGLAFTVPHLFWKSKEKFKVARFVKLIREEYSFKSLEEIDGRKDRNSIKISATYFIKNLGYNRYYAGTYLFCEFLNLLLVLGTFWITDWFLSGQFQNYGLDYAHYLWGKREMSNLVNPMDKVFPKVTKCDFKKFGPSGEIVKYDIVCILALNVISEKIFLGLWFWLSFLFIVQIALCLQRGIFVTFPTARAYSILNSNSSSDHSVLKPILNRLSYSDWFLFKKLYENLDPSEFSEFCNDLASHLGSNFHNAASNNVYEDINFPISNFGVKRRRKYGDSISIDEEEQGSLYNLRELKALEREQELEELSKDMELKLVSVHKEEKTHTQC